MKKIRCKKCGQSVGELAILAMLSDLGCVVAPLPTICSDGDEHDFVEAKRATREET